MYMRLSLWKSKSSQ